MIFRTRKENALKPAISLTHTWWPLGNLSDLLLKISSKSYERESEGPALNGTVSHRLRLREHRGGGKNVRAGGGGGWGGRRGRGGRGGWGGWEDVFPGRTTTESDIPSLAGPQDSTSPPWQADCLSNITEFRTTLRHREDVLEVRLDAPKGCPWLSWS